MKKVLKIVLKVLLFIIGAIVLFYIGWIALVLFNTHKENEAIKREKEEMKIRDSLLLVCVEKEAYENIKVGNIIAYEKAIVDDDIYGDIVYNNYGMYYVALIPKVLKFYKPAIKIMDSVILARYGNDFFERIAKEEDSISKTGLDYSIDLDGYHTFARRNPKYECDREDENYLKYIEKKLLKYKILPWKKDSCCANELVIDAVITKGGKLINPRVLLKVDPVVDSTVVSLLKKLPCNWYPAVSWNEEKKEYEVVDFRKKFHFDLSHPNYWYSF